MPKRKKEPVPRIESQPPRPPRHYSTSINARKDFPLKSGDVLIVRNVKGRVTERYTVGEYMYTLDEIRTFDAEKIAFDRA